MESIVYSTLHWSELVRNQSEWIMYNCNMFDFAKILCQSKKLQPITNVRDVLINRLAIKIRTTFFLILSFYLFFLFFVWGYDFNSWGMKDITKSIVDNRKISDWKYYGFPPTWHRLAIKSSCQPDKDSNTPTEAALGWFRFCLEIEFMYPLHLCINRSLSFPHSSRMYVFTWYYILPCFNIFHFFILYFFIYKNIFLVCEDMIPWGKRDFTKFTIDNLVDHSWLLRPTIHNS